MQFIMVVIANVFGSNYTRQQVGDTHGHMRGMLKVVKSIIAVHPGNASDIFPHLVNNSLLHFNTLYFVNSFLWLMMAAASYSGSDIISWTSSSG
jgi:hypothetical protein